MEDLTQKYPDVKKAREKAQFNGGSLQGATTSTVFLKLTF